MTEQQTVQTQAQSDRETWREPAQQLRVDSGGAPRGPVTP